VVKLEELLQLPDGLNPVTRKEKKILKRVSTFIQKRFIGLAPGVLKCLQLMHKRYVYCPNPLFILGRTLCIRFFLTKSRKLGSDNF